MLLIKDKIRIIYLCSRKKITCKIHALNFVTYFFKMSKSPVWVTFSVEMFSVSSRSLLSVTVLDSPCGGKRHYIQELAGLWPKQKVCPCRILQWTSGPQKILQKFLPASSFCHCLLLFVCLF